MNSSAHARPDASPTTAGGGVHLPFRLPALRVMARHAMPRVLEGAVAPAVLFYVGFVFAGLWGGVVAALVWSYGATVVRVVRGLPVGGLLLLSVLAVTVRAALSLATGSVFVYLLQPTLGTFAAGGAFLASAVARRPLTERLSGDFVDLPDHVRDHPAVRRLHVWLSLLWAVTLLTNGAVALWLLLSQSVGTYLVSRTAATGVVMALAIALSVRLFLRCIHRNRVPHHETAAAS